MRTFSRLVLAVLIAAAASVFAQQRPASTLAAPTESAGEKAKSDKTAEEHKVEARKARREHRRTVNHRQRRKH